DRRLRAGRSAGVRGAAPHRSARPDPHARPARDVAEALGGAERHVPARDDPNRVRAHPPRARLPAGRRDRAQGLGRLAGDAARTALWDLRALARGGEAVRVAMSARPVAALLFALAAACQLDATIAAIPRDAAAETPHTCPPEMANLGVYCIDLTEVTVKAYQ